MYFELFTQTSHEYVVGSIFVNCLYIINAGGSCGYGESVSQAPFSSMVTGIGPSLYNSGKECGACYQVLKKCDELI